MHKKTYHIPHSSQGLISKLSPLQFKPSHSLLLVIVPCEHLRHFVHSVQSPHLPVNNKQKESLIIVVFINCNCRVLT